MAQALFFCSVAKTLLEKKTTIYAICILRVVYRKNPILKYLLELFCWRKQSQKHRIRLKNDAKNSAERIHPPLFENGSNALRYKVSRPGTVKIR